MTFQGNGGKVIYEKKEIWIKDTALLFSLFPTNFD